MERSYFITVALGFSSISPFRHFAISPFRHFAISPFRVLNTPCCIIYSGLSAGSTYSIQFFEVIIQAVHMKGFIFNMICPVSLCSHAIQ